MSRSERWNTVNEIKRRFHETTDPVNGAGPVVYVENGRKYSDDSESHIAVIGRTGKGKSQCCSLPYMREILKKGESLIMLDPKGEGYKKNACYIPEHYQVFCVDFRNPRKSPTKWNPLSTPYRLFCSKDPDDNDIASSMLSELWNGVYPYDGHSDKFWTDSSVNYAEGLTYGLFETAGKETINLDSVAVMMEQSEIRFGGPSNTILKEFYEQLPLDSLAKRNLATYVTAPNETRASIHSVAASGLEVFSRSKGLIIKEQLITASQLAAMPTATALVMVDSQYKFIAHLPFYDEMYDNSKWKAPQYKPTASGKPFKSLDFEAMVKGIKKKQMESTLSGFSAERKTPAVPTGFPFFEEARSDGPMDIDSLVSRIDAKIAELEAEEEAERKKQGADKKHHVIITEGQSNRARIARAIASATGESLEKAAKRLAQFPVDIAFSTKSEAVKFAKDVTNAGGKATIKTS